MKLKVENEETAASAFFTPKALFLSFGLFSSKNRGKSFFLSKLIAFKEKRLTEIDAKIGKKIKGLFLQNYSSQKDYRFVKLQNSCNG